MSSITLCLIVARARNGAIGKDGGLPWRLSDDLVHFKTTTKGCPVIMGRKTWESLPTKPLPGRDNIVLSRDGQYEAPRARVFTAMPAAIAAGRALASAAGRSELFVVGGEAIYAAALPHADRLYITDVDADIDGDAFFPKFDAGVFAESDSRRIEADAKNQYSFTIRTLDRLA